MDICFFICDHLRRKIYGKRYRYAFAKKREAQQGKLSAVLAAVSLVLFVTAVLLAFFAGTIRIYCRRDQSLRNASVCIWICDGTEKLFRRKPDTQSRYDRLYCKRNHNDRMAGNLSDGNFRLINREV